MGRYFKDDYTPWSFVAPIALAVMFGVLAADVVRLIVAGVMAHAALEQVQESLNKESGAVQLQPALQLPPVDPVRGPAAPALPGLLEARRHHLDRACIGGTVSLRESNGWSQDTSSGSPERCTATSP